MGTKNKPGEFDAFGTAEPDEPMFVLIARDWKAPILVDLWAELYAARVDHDPRKLAEARRCADEMREWRLAH